MLFRVTAASSGIPHDELVFRRCGWTSFAGFDKAFNMFFPNRLEFPKALDPSVVSEAWILSMGRDLVFFACSAATGQLY